MRLRVSVSPICFLFVQCKNHTSYIHCKWQRDRRERRREGGRGREWRGRLIKRDLNLRAKQATCWDQCHWSCEQPCCLLPPCPGPDVSPDSGVFSAPPPPPRLSILSCHHKGRPGGSKVLAYQCEQCPSMDASYESLSLDSLDPHSLPILSTSKDCSIRCIFPKWRQAP